MKFYATGQTLRTGEIVQKENGLLHFFKVALTLLARAGIAVHYEFSYADKTMLAILSIAAPTANDRHSPSHAPYGFSDCT
jgi:hypothetical protein